MAGRVASRRFVFGGSVELDILCRAAPSEEGEAARAGEQELDGLSALRGEDVCDTIGWDLWEGEKRPPPESSPLAHPICRPRC